jgi:glycerophosphoryl diester phosphodiesterase
MPTHPLLLGHRGARGAKSGEKSILENTLAAFDFALAQGCDGFEFDVRLSGDGQAVIFHDAEIHDPRVRGVEVAKLPTQKLALPLLRDVLQRYGQRAFLDIELKVPGLESITRNLLRAHPPLCGYVVSSFLPEVLREIHRLNASIPLGLICERQGQFDAGTELPVQYAILHQRLIRESVVADLKNAGRKLFVWTVNSARDMKQLADWGVDGIISDDPKNLVATLRHK